MKRRGLFSILVALILVGVLITFLIAFQVRISERALVFTFGRVDRTIIDPGLYFKWPYPIQTVQHFDTRMKVLEGKFQEVYTADGKNLIVTVAIGWSIDDPKKYYNSLKTEDEARAQIEGLVGGETNAVIGRHTFGQFVSTDEKKLAFDQIEAEILGDAAKKQGVASTTESRYGIKMHLVHITQLGLPEKVTEKVFARMKAERERIAKKYRSEGKSKADMIRADADRQKQILLSDAEAAATRLRGEGDAAAADAYKVFHKNEELAIFLRKLEAIRKLKDRLTVIIDTKQPPWDLLRGTLDQILPGRKATPAPSPARPKPGGK